MKKHRGGEGFMAQPLSRPERSRGMAVLFDGSPNAGTPRIMCAPLQESTPTMNYRKFGRTGWNVSEIGYGMWGLAGWTGSDDAESLDALQRAVDLGCTFFDTAWAYGDGRSEQILGKV